MVHVLNKILKDYKPSSPCGEDAVKEIVARTPQGDEVTIHIQNTVHPDGVYGVIAGSVGGIICKRVIELSDKSDGAQSKVISVGHFPHVEYGTFRLKESASEIVTAFKEAGLPAPKIVTQRSVGSIFYKVIDKLGLM